jgi:REP element-mobilizing transposase RayT/CheY-like chemotaxis protein
MVLRVLIVTPTQGFGALIQQTLQEDDNYRTVLASNGLEALERARQIPFTLAILDSDLRDMPLREVGESLLELLPDIRLIAIPPNNNPQSPLLSGLEFHGYLSKPFYMPDLMDTISEVIGPITHQIGVRRSHLIPPKPESNPAKFSNPANSLPDLETQTWLLDVTRAAQHLARLSMSSAAQAALILRDGQLWAYAGQLSQPALQELSHAVASDWSKERRSDLARFIHLNATKSEYLLYATGLNAEMMLALIFDTEMPFSKIRNQVGKLAKELTAPPFQEAESHPETFSPPSSEIDLGLESWETGEVDDEREQIPLPPLFSLKDVPPPTPLPGNAQALDSSNERDAWMKEFSADPDAGAPSEPSGFEMPEARLRDDGNTESRKASAEEAVFIREDEVQDRITTSSDETVVESVSDNSLADISRSLELEPASAAFYHLSYACVMIPRLPQHHLTGDLSAHLANWMRQLCLAFNWRLEYLAIRPGYVHWIASMPPSTSPGYLMRMMRQHTSQRIFSEHARLREENPSGDFWAPGYLIISGVQPLPGHIVKEFIEQTRQRQGAANAHT